MIFAISSGSRPEPLSATLAIGIIMDLSGPALATGT